jgi:hypothetical protein
MPRGLYVVQAALCAPHALAAAPPAQIRFSKKGGAQLIIELERVGDVGSGVRHCAMCPGGSARRRRGLSWLKRSQFCALGASRVIEGVGHFAYRCCYSLHIGFIRSGRARPGCPRSRRSRPFPPDPRITASTRAERRRRKAILAPGRLHLVGLRPKHPVERTSEGARAGRDELCAANIPSEDGGWVAGPPWF